MKTINSLCLFLIVSCSGCSKVQSAKSINADTVDTVPQTIAATDSTIEESAEYPDDLSLFKSVVDTLNSTGATLVFSEYFLYDITGDDIPELWVRSGTCEADKELWVYHAKNGNVRKIFSDDGGHADFFLNGNIIGSVTCNCGAGYVSIYRYDNGELKVQTAEFSTWNDECEARAVKKKEQSLIEIWESSSHYIPFNPLN